MDVQNVRVSVIGGPIFSEEDLPYRGVLVPRSFWKLIGYLGADGRLRASAFILSQSNLLSDRETIDFDPFRLYQVSVAELADRTGLGFRDHLGADVMANPALADVGRAAEEMAASSRPIREIVALGDLRF